MTLKKVAFVGLGIMGRPMALNLIKAGYQLYIYARRAESLTPLQSTNAVVCSTPAEAMSQADYAITIVSDTPDVEQLVLGTDGLSQGAAPGNIIIDMSTIDPQKTRDIARQLKTHDVNMLDAPVSGGDIGAINGTLSIMAGGDEKVFRLALPIFKVLGENITHIGSNGSGQTAKACNQLLVAQTIMAVGEALAYARAQDVDPARVRESLLGGFAYSRVLEVHGKKLLDDEYVPGFKSELLLKDLNIIVSALEKSDLSLPGTTRAHEKLNALIDRGDGELDCAALGRTGEE